MQRDLEPPSDGLPHGARNNDPTCRCLGLQPGRHIYSVAVDVVALDDNIAEVKADPEHDGLIVGLAAICLDHRLLEFYGRGERVHGAGELNQASVALEPDHSTAAARGGWREPLVQMFEKPRNCAALIPTHQPRRSNRVCKKDRGQFALLTRQRYSPWVATESVGVRCSLGNR